MIKTLSGQYIDRIDVTFSNTIGEKVLVRFALTLEEMGTYRFVSGRGLSYFYDVDDIFSAPFLNDIWHNLILVQDLIFSRSNGLIRITNFTAFYTQYHIGLSIKKEFYDRYNLVTLLKSDVINKETSVAWLGFYPMFNDIFQLMNPQSSNE